MPTHTIAENLQRLVDAKADIASAITEMGGTVNTGDGFEEFPADIGTIPTGVPSDKPVQFIDDADGSIVYSYTAEEFANLSEMPPNPTHEGLISRGWNWTLSDAKSCVANQGQLCIGQMYDTDDGSTRLYVTISSNTMGTSSYVTLQLTLSRSCNLTIDWGDETTSTMSNTSTSSVSTKSVNHTYASYDDYVISISASSGEYYFAEGSSSKLITPTAILTRMEIGNGSYFSLYDHSNLRQVILPIITGSISEPIQRCHKLSQVTVPSGIVWPASGYDVCYECNALVRCSIPNGIGDYWSLDSCRSLQQITIPDGSTRVNGINDCYMIQHITIPESITFINSNAFKNCYCLRVIKFMNQTPPQVNNSNAWTGLPSYCVKILVPAGSLSSYTSATNYPSKNSYIYEEY